MIVGLTFPAASVASDRIDSPGPGYRMQKTIFDPRGNGEGTSFLRITPELFFDKTTVTPGKLRADKPTGLIESLPTDNPFSKPIQLFPTTDPRQ